MKELMAFFSVEKFRPNFFIVEILRESLKTKKIVFKLQQPPMTNKLNENKKSLNTNQPFKVLQIVAQISPDKHTAL